MAAEAQDLARQLDGENVRRQEEEASIYGSARKLIENDPAVGARSILVVACDGWHRGVIGIVASKLVESFHRPVIVISVEGEDRARLVPQHSRIRYARGARAERARISRGLAATSRPPA